MADIEAESEQAAVQAEAAGTRDAVIRATLAKAEVTREHKITEDALESIEHLTTVAEQNLVPSRTGTRAFYTEPRVCRFESQAWWIRSPPSTTDDRRQATSTGWFVVKMEDVPRQKV